MTDFYKRSIDLGNDFRLDVGINEYKGNHKIELRICSKSTGLRTKKKLFLNNPEIAKWLSEQLLELIEQGKEMGIW